MTDAAGQLAEIYRREAGRCTATLIRVLGDIDLAEDAVAEAFAIAAEQWPVRGVPPNPGGWITTTGRNRAIDRLRRESTRDERHRAAHRLHTEDMGHDPNPHPDQPELDALVDVIADDQLRLMFLCCHPALAADAQVAQAADQRRAALVSSLAELARDYIQLRGVQTQIRIANDNLKIDRDVLELVRERQQKGVQNGLDVESAAAQVESIRAQIPALRQQEVEYVNALSLLLGEQPGALKAELARAKAVPSAPPRVPVGIPSELARRRPDIRAAEAQLHAATAGIGVAVGDFYPSVQLNGTVGFDSLELKDLWKASSLQYTVGPTVTLPIFAGGRLKSTLELRKAQQIEAAITYRKTVLQAWHEVVNAMVAYRLERQRRGRLQAQVEHARQALSLARDRYRDGVADFLTVLDAERTLLEASQQQATSTTNVSLDLVQLFKALGGGWETTFPDRPAGGKLVAGALDASQAVQ